MPEEKESKTEEQQAVVASAEDQGTQGGDDDLEKMFSEAVAGLTGNAIEPPTENGGEKNGEPEPKEAEPKEKTALELAEERAKERGVKKPEPEAKEEKPEHEPAPKPEPKREPSVAAPDGLPETYKVGDNVYVTKDVLEQTGMGEELAGLIDIMAERRAAKAFEQLAQSDPYKKMEERVAQLTQELQHDKFLNAISVRSGIDAHAIDSNPKHDFWGWLPQQSKGIQALPKTGDPDDAVVVLEAYKEFKMAERNKAVDDERRKEKERIDALHKNTVRDERTGKFKQSEGDKDDYDESFKKFAAVAKR